MVVEYYIYIFLQGLIGMHWRHTKIILCVVSFVCRLIQFKIILLVGGDNLFWILANDNETFFTEFLFSLLATFVKTFSIRS